MKLEKVSGVEDINLKLLIYLQCHMITASYSHGTSAGFVKIIHRVVVKLEKIHKSGMSGQGTKGRGNYGVVT